MDSIADKVDRQKIRPNLFSDRRSRRDSNPAQYFQYFQYIQIEMHRQFANKVEDYYEYNASW